MKKWRILMITTSFFLGISLACSLPGPTPPTPTAEPESTPVTPVDEATASETPLPTEEPSIPEPTPTETLPTVEPTDSPASMGQIAYTFNGNIWRFIIDTNQNLQVTTDGVPGDYMNIYGWARFSPDGRYLAFNRGNSSYILDLVTEILTDISAYGQFFSWQGEGNLFFAVQGDFECPPIEDLDDQVLINFNIIRLDLNNLLNSEILANIGGGLKYLQAISPDGQWASVVGCACYSECGGTGLYNLPTLSTMAPAIDLYPGTIDFSSDSTQLTVSQWQMFGYEQSPLYVANSNYSGMFEIFNAPNVAPINAKWSPNGNWIAFTGVVFSELEFEDVDRCVRLVKPDGSQQVLVECTFADFITWAPDGSQLLYSQVSGTQDVFYIYDLATNSTTSLPFQVDPYTMQSIDWGKLP